MGIIKEKLEELDQKKPDVSHSIESILMDYMGKDHHFCGCGAPGEVYKYLRGVLNMIPAGSDDNMGLTEHGGSVPGWLTDKGIKLRDMLNELEIDGCDLKLKGD